MGKSYKSKLIVKTNKLHEALKQFAGIYRFAFNKSLDYQWYRMTHNKRRETQITPLSMIKECFEADRKSFTFIENADSGLINKAMSNAYKSFHRWFNLRMCFSLSHNNYKRAKYPSYLARKTDGMRFSSSSVKIFYDHIKIPKIGKIGLYEKGYLPQGVPFKTVTLSHDGKDWWITVEVFENSEKSVVNPEENLWLDFLENGSLITGDKVYENVIMKDSYKKETKKLKALTKKLGRQKNSNTVLGPSGSPVIRTSRNMVKTRNKILRVKSRMDRIKKDYFKKVVCELARSKSGKVHVLSKRTISDKKQNYETRILRESSTRTFANMLLKKFKYSGAEIIRHSDSTDIEEHLCTSISKGKILTNS